MRVTVAASGQVGGCPFTATTSVAQGERRIDCTVRFDFGRETWIGDPWDWGQVDWDQRRRSYHDERWKLQAVFPVSWKRQAIYKDAAYDVCQSRLNDTFYQRWDEVKHNVVLNWVDVFDPEGQHGLAVFSDRTASYAVGPDHPLGLVLGWG